MTNDPWTDDRLRQVVEANLSGHFEYIARRHPRMQVIDLDRIRLVDSTFATDTFNVVFGVAQHECVDAGLVATVVSYFRERALPFSWWVGPTTDIEKLRPAFAAAGLFYAEGETAMAVPARAFTQPAPEAPVDVRRVRSHAELADYARVLAANWDPPDAEVEAFYKSAAGILLEGGSPFRLWVGYAAGEAVATAELFVESDIGGVYNISTRAQSRGRRIGSLLSWTALLEARRLGLAYAVLQAADAGRGVYERLGFRPCGSFGEFK